MVHPKLHVFTKIEDEQKRQTTQCSGVGRLRDMMGAMFLLSTNLFPGSSWHALWQNKDETELD